MSWYTNPKSSVTPDWKSFIETFEKQNPPIPPSKNQPSNDQRHVQSIKDTPKFLSGITMLLAQIKSYNNEVADFVRRHIFQLLKESIRMILEIPHAAESDERKNKFPFQALEFIEGLVALPNIFSINVLNQELYEFYCRVLFDYYRKNHQFLHRQSHNNQTLQNSLYKNYFLRLFEVPYNVTENESRMGINYSSTLNNSSSISFNGGSSITPSIKRLSFLECLIEYLKENPSQINLITNCIEKESMMNCLNKVLLMNGLHNYPYALKEQALRSLFEVKSVYLRLLSSKLKEVKEGRSSMSEDNSAMSALQLKVENILEIEFNIVNRSPNIYDGVPLFELICSSENIKTLVELQSINVIYRDRASVANGFLVPPFIQEHLSELFLIILHKDYSLYHSQLSSNQQSIQVPPISLEKINSEVLPLVIGLKELINPAEKSQIKPSITHLNLIKIFYVMILNRLKYRSNVEVLLKKHDMLSVLIAICQKYHQNDILVNAIMEIFKSIFKGQINIAQSSFHFNASSTKGGDPSNNYQEIKKLNDQIEEMTFLQIFKACNSVLRQVRAFKSHKEPLFGQFFKMAKVIREYAKSYYSMIDQAISVDSSATSSSRTMPVANCQNIAGGQMNPLLEPVFLNAEIKSKCKEWYDFYQENFQSIENNYQRDLGKFDEFENNHKLMQQQKPTEYSVNRLCPDKSITCSQAISNRAEFEASMQNSIEILRNKDSRNQEGGEGGSATDSQGEKESGQNSIALDFKKMKPSTAEGASIPILQPSSNDTQANHLQNQHEIDLMISEPIKIEFKKKSLSRDTAQSESDSASEDISEDGLRSDSETNTFQDFMRKKMTQIKRDGEELIKRKKSKTPTKIKALGDSKTPPKMKKWGSTSPSPINQTQVPQQNSNQSFNKQIIQTQSESTGVPHKQSENFSSIKRNCSNGVEQQSIKNEANIQPSVSGSQIQAPKTGNEKNKISCTESNKISIIKVGGKVPKHYKQRKIDPQHRDARLVQWLRA